MEKTAVVGVSWCACSVQTN